jgi:hypothetical protein
MIFIALPIILLESFPAESTSFAQMDIEQPQRRQRSRVHVEIQNFRDTEHAAYVIAVLFHKPSGFFQKSKNSQYVKFMKEADTDGWNRLAEISNQKWNTQLPFAKFWKSIALYLNMAWTHNRNYYRAIVDRTKQIDKVVYTMQKKDCSAKVICYHAGKEFGCKISPSAQKCKKQMEKTQKRFWNVQNKISQFKKSTEKVKTLFDLEDTDKLVIGRFTFHVPKFVVRVHRNHVVMNVCDAQKCRLRWSYKSKSAGGYRMSPGMDANGRYQKGWDYAHLTKPCLQLEAVLNDLPEIQKDGDVDGLLQDVFVKDAHIMKFGDVEYHIDEIKTMQDRTFKEETGGDDHEAPKENLRFYQRLKKQHDDGKISDETAISAYKLVKSGLRYNNLFAKEFMMKSQTLLASNELKDFIPDLENPVDADAEGLPSTTVHTILNSESNYMNEETTLTHYNGKLGDLTVRWVLASTMYNGEMKVFVHKIFFADEMNDVNSYGLYPTNIGPTFMGNKPIDYKANWEPAFVIKNSYEKIDDTFPMTAGKFYGKPLRQVDDMGYSDMSDLLLKGVPFLQKFRENREKEQGNKEMIEEFDKQEFLELLRNNRIKNAKKASKSYLKVRMFLSLFDSRSQLEMMLYEMSRQQVLELLKELKFIKYDGDLDNPEEAFGEVNEKLKTDQPTLEERVHDFVWNAKREKVDSVFKKVASYNTVEDYNNIMMIGKDEFQF